MYERHFSPTHFTCVARTRCSGSILFRLCRDAEASFSSARNYVNIVTVCYRMLRSYAVRNVYSEHPKVYAFRLAPLRSTFFARRARASIFTEDWAKLQMRKFYARVITHIKVLVPKYDNKLTNASRDALWKLDFPIFTRFLVEYNLFQVRKWNMISF